MVFCKQKYKHCFVACCASLIGKSDIASQEEIVKTFPHELQKGKGIEIEGMALGREEAKTVLKGLKISKNPEFYEMELVMLSGNLKRNKIALKEKVIIFRREPTKHCIVIKEIFDDKMKVMDPHQQYNDFRTMEYSELEDSDPIILLL